MEFVYNIIIIILKGACHDNVIQGGKLSSGYYEYDTDSDASHMIPKPQNAGW